MFVTMNHMFLKNQGTLGGTGKTGEVGSFSRTSSVLAHDGRELVIDK